MRGRERGGEKDACGCDWGGGWTIDALFVMINDVRCVIGAGRGATSTLRAR